MTMFKLFVLQIKFNRVLDLVSNLQNTDVLDLDEPVKSQVVRMSHGLLSYDLSVINVTICG